MSIVEISKGKMSDGKIERAIIEMSDGKMERAILKMLYCKMDWVIKEFSEGKI